MTNVDFATKTSLMFVRSKLCFDLGSKIHPFFVVNFVESREKGLEKTGGFGRSQIPCFYAYFYPAFLVAYFLFFYILLTTEDMLEKNQFKRR